MTNIAELIEGKPLIHVGPEQSVRSVARMMSDRNIGAVAVLDGETLVGVFSERKLFRLRVAEISRRPFQLLHLRVRWSGRLRGTHPHVSFGPRVRASGPEALNGIHHERQRLEVEAKFEHSSPHE